ncbi:MAG TPA: hypothetical protein VIP46_04375 [Pyrinomonadaceae bacterium]
MDLLNLILAVALGVAALVEDGERATTTDTNAASASQTTTVDDTDEARSNIIDIGANGQ